MKWGYINLYKFSLNLCGMSRSCDVLEQRAPNVALGLDQAPTVIFPSGEQSCPEASLSCIRLPLTFVTFATFVNK